MKKNLLFVSIVFSLFYSQTAGAQAVVHSSNGYSVNVVITPKTIVPTGNSCQYGYNYNVKFDYSVVFEGSNKPSSLYTLQGTMGCGISSHFFSLPKTQGSGNKNSQSNVWRSVSDCATATVSNLLCNTVTLEIEGPGISHQFVTFSVSSIPLPVKLVQFNAEALKGKVKINWQTATEINSDHFVIERSVNGASWDAIKTVTAAGNSSALVDYTAYDENPVMGTAQYRVNMVDADGKAEYSPTRSVKYTGSSLITVFPVPNAGNTIHFTGIAEPSKMIMTIINMSGATEYQTVLRNSKTELPQLKAGIYIIRLADQATGEVENLRYVKI